MDRRGFNKNEYSARWRLYVEWLPGDGEVTLRLPFRLAITFEKPWWQIGIGLYRSGGLGWREFRWELLCFSGEIWIEQKLIVCGDWGTPPATKGQRLNERG